ncbi:hypothetical protein RLDS_21400 [Sphingobium lactosutens DS20]|uniref:Uncharacterized protein n=1 Tax=Sphingobium lactosutens DS20 TaxID=1331060 RepID=T0IPV5_9SPHN|nr:hypothetical protein RLDS_21400 [Sphingobium lactosutens DS20]
MAGSCTYQAFGPTSAWIDEDYVAFKTHSLRALDGEKTKITAVKRGATCIAHQPCVPAIVPRYGAETRDEWRDSVRC